MGVSFQVTFDCAGPAALAEFWKTALGYRTDDPPPPFQTWEEAMKAWGIPEDFDDVNAIIDPAGVGPRVFFQKVPEGKTVKNRVHLDINIGRGIDDPDARWAAVRTHVDRLVAAGASEVDERHDEYGGRWMVMTDPEGNEFCVQ